MAHLSRTVLADNIKRMIERKGVSLRAWAMQHKLHQRQIDRIVKEECSTTLDTLDEIAERLGVQAWQLLVPNMRIDELPSLQLSKVERELYERIAALAKTMKNE